MSTNTRATGLKALFAALIFTALVWGVAFSYEYKRNNPNLGNSYQSEQQTSTYMVGTGCIIGMRKQHNSAEDLTRMVNDVFFCMEKHVEHLECKTDDLCF